MHIYTTEQWVLLFFFYCFCGWLWESCYVSVHEKHWVNRGFLQGPLLPIYGSGAIIILLATIPVEENLQLVFLFGMAAATMLEYATGAVMERIFGMRYWDYSSKKWNLNGYICLSSSIAWGFFSILMVRYIHPPIARLLAQVPAWCVDPLALAMTAGFTADAVRSVQAALDLRESLTKLAEENETLRRLAKRAEVYAAFASDDLQRFRERTEVEKRLLQQRIDAGLVEQQKARSERRAERQARVEAAVRRRTAAKLDVLETISDALETCRNHLDSLDLTPERLEARRAGLRSRPANVYHRSLRILRGNPTAAAKAEFQEALEALRRLNERK